MQFVDLNAQLSAIRQQIDARIAKVLNHGQFIMGPEVYELEQQLADYVGVKHCVTCANGTDALQIALMSSEIGANDIVLTTAFSFIATAEVIPAVGATPYFVDVDPETFNLCPNKLEAAIADIARHGLGTPKAVIVVDLFGLPANYTELNKICKKYNLILIEDAAQSFGATLGTRKCGSFGEIATTSFFPAKPLGCFGDGGALFTDSLEIADIARSIRIHGKGANKYDNKRLGLNSRLDTMQAAILLEKLLLIDSERARRHYLAQQYHTNLKGLISCPSFPNEADPSWAAYTITIADSSRDPLCEHLSSQGIPTAIYYKTPLHLQMAMKAHTVSRGRLTIAESLSKSVISLPIHAYLEEASVAKICEQIEVFMQDKDTL